MMHVRVVGMVSQITDARKQVVFLTNILLQKHQPKYCRPQRMPILTTNQNLFSLTFGFYDDGFREVPNSLHYLRAVLVGKTFKGFLY